MESLENERKKDERIGKEAKSSLLLVNQLSIGFPYKKEICKVVQQVSFELFPGEILGIVGESGSGKSISMYALIGLLSRGAKIIEGSILFDGKELTLCSNREYQELRGKEIAMVFQEPMTSLNPVLTIGKQAEEMLLLHEKDLGKKERKQKVLEMFEETGLPNTDSFFESYPHQLSGGMRQRVMIAMAMLCRPKLLIADEPTTALDVTLQSKILELLKKLNQEYKTSILFISHDLGVIKTICTRAIVMQKGRCVEQGNLQDIFSLPKNAYTKQLLSAALGQKNWIKEKNTLDMYQKKNLLVSVQKLSVCYKQNKKAKKSGEENKEAVKNVSFEIYKGETLGIVGESGSGKSTLAKALVGLIKEKTGQIEYDKKEIIYPQMVFQDPYGSLNPSKTIGWLLEEPLRFQKKFEKRKLDRALEDFKKRKLDKKERKKVIETMIEKVGLPSEYLYRYPLALSGGQRQRVAIAIALIQNPKLIILDEPVSALDVTIQEQILTLLAQIKKEYGLSYLFISHDLSVVRRFCNRVCVMYKGELIETAQTEHLFQFPKHNYTKQLLSSMVLP